MVRKIFLPGLLLLAACGQPRVLARRESDEGVTAPVAERVELERRGQAVPAEPSPGEDDPVDDPVDDDPVDDDPVDDDPIDGDPVDTAPVDDAPVDEPHTPVDPGIDDGMEDAACTEDSLPTPNEGLDEPAGLDGCPPGMAAATDAACMDRWEAHLVELVDGAVAPFSPFAHPAGAVVIARSAPGAVPQGYVSGIDAASACDAAGKRLCTDTEWTRACRGEEARVYPYGDAREPGVCNDARATHPVVEYFETGAVWIWSELGHPCINQQANTVERTGDNAGCVDESGRFFDLMGNLHEWIDDPAGTFRGGFYVDTALNGPGCLYRTTAHNTAHWDYSTGFRCCADR